MLEPESKHDKTYSSHELPKIDDTYVLDPSSGIYTPKSYQEAKERKKKREWLPLIISALGLVLWGATIFFANKQWGEMKKTTIASTNAANTAACALDENKKQFTQMFGEIQKQTGAQVNSGKAAKDAAGIAKDTLNISERAYVTAGSPQADTSKNVINIPIYNTGHIPTGEATASIYEVTLEQEEPLDNIPLDNVVERHRDIMIITSVAASAGSTYSLTIPTPKISMDRLNKGTQTIVLAGEITYNDGFPKTPIQTAPVCTKTIYHLISKQFYWVPCNEGDIMNKLNTLDWTKLTNRFK